MGWGSEAGRNLWLCNHYGKAVSLKRGLMLIAELSLSLSFWKLRESVRGTSTSPTASKKTPGAEWLQGQVTTACGPLGPGTRAKAP